MPGIVLTIDQKAMQAVKAALTAEADGAALRTSLTKNLKTAMVPAVNDAKQAILAMPSKAVHTEPLRQSIAQAIKPSVSYTGKSTGATIKAAKNKYPRGFKSAPAATNARGWQHPVFGNTPKVFQVGAPGWFDKVKEHLPEYREAIVESLIEMAERIAARSKS
jgi:hypothetical protein